VTVAVRGNEPRDEGVPAKVPNELRIRPSTVKGLKARVPVPPEAAKVVE
jgi:hypothetical protein